MTVTQLIRDNYRYTLRFPRDRDLRSTELRERFAKAQRDQRAREWLRCRVVANVRNAEPSRGNVLWFAAK